ncbi:ras-related and estrogen-regulated growth inhibitor-like protein [Thrips palmi]|uniref:small monomeric GTPase n=1 Tax=Thrips palmi TaxID=161013 RepID=A0A6P8ZJG1_THRPL|nr:ras-related and estrogen-regulated growth inhibitor-like protein [Thrips palmi]
MKSEDKSAGRVRIAVLGKFNVGKSALIVRYLTRRFIGEYRSNTDLLYLQAVVVKGSLMDVEIVDVSGETRDSPLEAAQLAADGVVVVYSITDRESFEYAQRVLELLSTVPGLPTTLLANKADLAHLRAVKESEGRALAETTNSAFYEVSVAEDSPGVYQAFELLASDCLTFLNNNNTLNSNNNNNNNAANSTTTRTRKFSVTKMLGTLISGKSSSPPPSSPPPSTSSCSWQQGTVKVCQKADLYRSGMLQRRVKKTSITASL